MKFVWGMLALAGVMGSSSAWAGVEKGLGGTAIKVKKSSIFKNKKFEEDHEISNAELRAQAGSRSRYSMKATLSYKGAPVAEPLSKNLPNPDKSVGAHKTSMGGTVSARYRLDKKSTLDFGSGVTMLTPFHGVERFDMQNPYLSYNRVFKAGKSVQMISSVKGMVVTNPDYVEVGEVAGLSTYQGVKYRLGSYWSLGMAVNLSVYYYNREYKESDRNASNYFVGLYPSLIYRLSRRLSFKTSISRGFRNKRKKDDWGALDNLTVSQKLGVGVSVTKDIYLNPYLYFYPEKLSWNRTSLSFSTIFSVF